MVEHFSEIFSKISLAHLNILFLLGLVLFGGSVGGRLFQKFHIPQVVGYIAIGLAIGESGLGIIDHEMIRMLEPFNYFALGLIGVMVGGDLHRGMFAKYGKQLITILLCEGIAPFLFVSLIVGFVGSFLIDWKIAWSLGLLFGAVASATDPATTTEVFREFKSRGPLTTTITGIVALDDGLALILFAIASGIAGTLSGEAQAGFLSILIHFIYDIFGALCVGAVAGLMLTKILKKYYEYERLLVFCIGTVLLVVGFSLAINVELLLSAMMTGAVVVNFTPRKSKDIFKILGGFTPPIYVLFFVLIGARLNFRHLNNLTHILVALYLFGTVTGKVWGSYYGAVISKAPEVLKKYLPFGLFSQAGVAIGLSILASQYFPGEIGHIIIIVITASTFILQLVGPHLTKYAVIGAKEAGLDISEEELMEKMSASDVMDKNPPVVYNNTSLEQILKTFSESSNLYHPVVDKDKKLLGIITVDNLKNIFTETGLSNFLLAVDVMEPSPAYVGPESSLTTVKELFDKHNLEYLPVLGEDKTMVGFIERRVVNKAISTKLMEFQKLSGAYGKEPR